MIFLGGVLVAVPVVALLYAYVGYPWLLRWLVRRDRRVSAVPSHAALPTVTLVLPAYNEARSIASTIEGLLALDYPADLRQILVVSDASDDGTDDVVRTYVSRGVELLRQPQRGGKTVAENAAAAHCRGEIVVTVDATVRVPPPALRHLVAAFADSSVGVASGRDVSAESAAAEATGAEGGYVDFEMTLRALETRFVSIVGASGCFFAVRRHLLESDYPPHLSKDFATPLRAWRRGYRSVSVDAAICVVRRTPVLAQEYRRKLRTMSRGLQTLWHERDLLNPGEHGRFAFMLWSHKVVRWLVFLTAPFALVGLGLLATAWPPARLALGACAVALGLGALAIRWPFPGMPPRLFAVLGFLVASHAAGFMAWVDAVRGRTRAVWEPTRREQTA